MDKVQIRGRFKDAPWFPKKNVDVLVGGAGGIGSWLSFLLARADFTPFIYDFDEVEVHNMGGQLFSKEHIGLKKVEAMKNIILEFSDKDIMVFDEKMDENTMSHKYFFSAFDNMQARKDTFEAWVAYTMDKPDAIFIDGRLLMEHMQIFCVTPDKVAEYRSEHLFDDNEVADEMCTMKQTSHSAAMIASLMVSFFTNHMTNVNQGSVVRQVPFYHEYFIPINLTS